MLHKSFICLLSLFILFTIHIFLFAKCLFTVLIIATWTATYCVSYEIYNNPYMHKLWASNPNLVHYKPCYGKKESNMAPCNDAVKSNITLFKTDTFSMHKSQLNFPKHFCNISIWLRLVFDYKTGSTLLNHH